MKGNNVLSVLMVVFLFSVMGMPVIAKVPPDYSYYERIVKDIDIPYSSLPQVVEITFPENTYAAPFSALVQDNTTKQTVNYYATASSTNLPLSYTINIVRPMGQNGGNLTDTDYKTFVDFPAESLTQENSSIIRISANPGKKLAISGIYFNYSQNSSKDFTITISALKPAGGKTILVAQKTYSYSATINFPQTESQEFELELNHKQPLRIAEIVPSLVNENERIANSYKLRFVSQANHSYSIYLNKDKHAPYKNYNTEAQLMNPVGNNIIRTTIVATQKNEEYVSPDTDGDSVPDVGDNCPRLANSDQKDENHNGVGDVCDDFDQDGVPNSMDNCLLLPNSSQLDKDGDKIGDVCDGVESRFSEKYPWLPWLGIAIGFAFTGGMLMLSLKQKKDLE